MKKTTTYVTTSKNSTYVKKLADSLAGKGKTVRVVTGSIGTWGSGIPGASNFGTTEPGTRIIVETSSPHPKQ